jgi:C4-dicarboxylate-specific signal transduction histidine kinase
MQSGVAVAIEDHGPGVPEDVRESLFKPFFTTKGEKGTGLGLWVSQGIVHKHGGTIDFASTTDAEEHGTTVTVFLANDPVLKLGGA